MCGGTAAKAVADGRSVASVAERVELLENLPGRGMLADAPGRITLGRRPGHCCAAGCKPDS
jgi:hypothetical protein